MSLKVLYVGKASNGTPIPDLIKMVHYSHPEVEFCKYEEGVEGDVLLCINRTMSEDNSGIKRVMYVGSVPSFLKAKGLKKFESVGHTFFISDYCKNLFIQGNNIENISVFLPFGPLPSDSNLEPVIGTRTIEGPIKFLAMAKWYKRPYKRLKSIVHLYREYLRKEYPDSILHVIGCKEDYVKDGVNYYRKSFHSQITIDLVKKCHVHIIPTSFDTGPKTITESLHYRVPFVCSTNCSGSEYMDILGKCGLEVETDEYIDSLIKYKKHRPLYIHSKFVKKTIPYDIYVKAIKNIIDNFEEYTSWEWNDSLNYKKQSDKLYNILKG